MAGSKRKASEAEVGSGDLQVTVVSVGGEAVMPRGPVATDVTVSELLQRFRRRGGSPEHLRLLHGGRRLAAHERLGDLEVPDPRRGLEITLVRQAVDAEAVAKLRAGAANGELSLYCRRDVGDEEVAAIAALLREPGCAVREVTLAGSSVADVAPLAEALRENASVEVLDLHFSKVSVVGSLPAALRANRTLQRLDLTACPVSSDVKEELRAVEREKAASGVDFRLRMGGAWAAERAVGGCLRRRSGTATASRPP